MTNSWVDGIWNFKSSLQGTVFESRTSGPHAFQFRKQIPLSTERRKLLRTSQWRNQWVPHPLLVLLDHTTLPVTLTPYLHVCIEEDWTALAFSVEECMFAPNKIERYEVFLLRSERSSINNRFRPKIGTVGSCFYDAKAEKKLIIPIKSFVSSVSVMSSLYYYHYYYMMGEYHIPWTNLRVSGTQYHGNFYLPLSGRLTCRQRKDTFGACRQKK